MASATAVEAAASLLVASSGMPPWGGGAYASVMPCGLSSSSAPSSARTSSVEAVEMPDRVDTAREFESPPVMVQPPLPLASGSMTGSVNVTRISLSEVARALSIVGLWASSRVRRISLAVPGLTTIEPVAFGVTSSTECVIVCWFVSLPETLNEPVLVPSIVSVP